MNDDPQLLHAGLAIIAALLYVGTSARQLICLDRQGGAQREPSVIYLAVGAVAFHAVLAWLELTDGGVDLGFYKVASFIFLAISVLSLLALLIRPLHMMIIATFPLAALCGAAQRFRPGYRPSYVGIRVGADYSYFAVTHRLWYPYHCRYHRLPSSRLRPENFVSTRSGASFGCCRR